MHANIMLRIGPYPDYKHDVERCMGWGWGWLGHHQQSFC